MGSKKLEEMTREDIKKIMHNIFTDGLKNKGNDMKFSERIKHADRGLEKASRAFRSSIFFKNDDSDDQLP